MLERMRSRHVEVGPSGGSSGDLFTPADGAEPVLVTHGFYAERLPVSGMTVGEIRARYHDRFDIGPLNFAVIGSQRANDATTVRAGQTLSFIHHAGEKGAGARCRW